MNEHVHEWYILAEGEGDLGIYCSKSIGDEPCTAYLTGNQAEARLNATERLSTKMATTIVNAIDRLAYATDGRDGGNASKALRAYANTLEGT